MTDGFEPTESAAPPFGRRLLLATGSLTALSTLLTGLAVQRAHLPAWVWFVPYSAFTLLLRAWALRQPVRSRPSRLLVSALVVGQAALFGLAAAARPGHWWIWVTAALAQFAVYAIGAWKTSG
ncbi:hypothetical protein AB0K43_10725 [Kitasatospora sp. NPDC049258]|uniref:hypothetical protein n=1 Tax=Kitasatospora sp. NPDC049258 TaxID=3155394 RepID=UPI0034306D79